MKKIQIFTAIVMCLIRMSNIQSVSAVNIPHNRLRLLETLQKQAWLGNIEAFIKILKIQNEPITDEEASSLILVSNVPLLNFLQLQQSIILQELFNPGTGIMVEMIAKISVTLSGGKISKDLDPLQACNVATIIANACAQYIATFFDGKQFSLVGRAKFASVYKLPEDVANAPKNWPSNIEYQLGIMIPEMWDHYQKLALRENNLGHGVYAKGYIPRTSILCCYTGRYEQNDLIKNWDYVATMINEFNDKISINAQEEGNLSRYINHDENPNCAFVRLPNITSIPCVFIQALKNIKEGDELFVHYGNKYWKDRKRTPVKNQN